MCIFFLLNIMSKMLICFSYFLTFVMSKVNINIRTKVQLQ